MENNQTYATDTLMGDLQGWNRQEKMFKETFGEESLKDREFLKMKLAEFNRLDDKYSKGPQTTDNLAMLQMLRFQRNSLEKKLYPNLLVRWYNRAIDFLEAIMIKSMTRRPVEKPYKAPEYHNVTIPTAGVQNGEKQNEARRQDNTQQQKAHQRYGQNLGQRPRHFKNTKKRMHM